MPVDCEIDRCGVIAVGRCSRCGLPFCMSHKALRYVDLCVGCDAIRARELSAGFATANFLDSPEMLQRRARHTATLLLAAGIGPTPRRQTTVENRRNLFGDRTEERVVAAEPAWPIGTWRFDGDHFQYRDGAETEAGVTRRGEVVPMNGMDLWLTSGQHARAIEQFEEFARSRGISL